MTEDGSIDGPQRRPRSRRRQLLRRRDHRRPRTLRRRRGSGGGRRGERGLAELVRRRRRLRPHGGHGGGRGRRRPVAVYLVVLMAASWHLDLTSLSENVTEHEFKEVDQPIHLFKASPLGIYSVQRGRRRGHHGT